MSQSDDVVSNDLVQCVVKEIFYDEGYLIMERVDTGEEFEIDIDTAINFGIRGGMANGGN